MKQSYIYIVVMALVLIIITGIFYVLPRPTFSELERRDLTEFPAFPSWKSDSLQSGLYTEDHSPMVLRYRALPGAVAAGKYAAG